MHDAESATVDRSVVVSVLFIVVLYTAWLLWGGFPGGRTNGGSHGADEPLQAESHTAPQDGAEVDVAETHSVATPPLWAVIPFVSLLGAIAIFPIWHPTAHWWESNLHRFYLAAGLALVTLLYYGRFDPHAGWTKVGHVLEHAILAEYVPFIVLLLSLYTISGGIRITGDLIATPRTNAAFLAVGGLLASFIGTTGAAMLLIRPLLETNAERKRVQHTVVFFIFIVCNCGGCLLPIGDPPLFLGYLKGVPFLWTLEYLWLPWLVVNVLLLAAYFAYDRWIAYPQEERTDLQRDRTQVRRLRLDGLMPNVLLLLGVVFSVALLDPSKTVPGTHWNPWPFLREIVQLILIAVSLQFGSRSARRANRFNYHAIVEVAALFIGIFICMQPALDILRVRGASLGLNHPHQYFWTTGSLSAVLDNAPTYVVFYETAAATPQLVGRPLHVWLTQTGDLAELAAHLLIAISLGAVFMGAMTYIGNGPNFMVRAIAEQAGVAMPSFFGYTLKYALPWLIPIFLITNWLVL